MTPRMIVSPKLINKLDHILHIMRINVDTKSKKSLTGAKTYLKGPKSKFLGLASYYWHFINDLAMKGGLKLQKLANPLGISKCKSSTWNLNSLTRSIRKSQIHRRRGKLLCVWKRKCFSFLNRDVFVYICFPSQYLFLIFTARP